MKFLTGDDTGILKWVRVEAQKVEKFGPQRRGDAVERLCWAGPVADREARVAVAHASGTVEIRETTNGQVLGSASMGASVKCLQALDTGAGAGGLLTVSADGSAGLLTVSADGSAGIVANWCAEEFPTTLQAPNGNDTEGATGPVVRKFELPGPIHDAKADPCGSERIVFGGGENDVKIWDMAKSEVVWRAKNVRENTLCLRVPVKVNVLQWATQLAPTRSLFLCGTSDGKIRLYDARAQRRPLFELVVGHGAGAGTGGYTGTVDEQARPLLCSSISTVRGDAWSLFVGNTMGVMREYDLRNLSTCQSAPYPPGRKAHLNWAAKQMPFRRGYRGIMGSIRAVDVHRSGEVMVSVGIGRFAYVFETRKKRMHSKVYLKQKLCSVLMSAEEHKAKQDDDDEGSEEEEGANGDDITGAEGSEDEVEEGFSDDEDAAKGNDLEKDDHEDEHDVDDADEDGEEEDEDEDEDEDADEDDDEEGGTATKRPAPAKKRRKQVERQQTVVIMPDDAPASAVANGAPAKKKKKKPNRKKKNGNSTVQPAEGSVKKRSTSNAKAAATKKKRRRGGGAAA